MSAASEAQQGRRLAGSIPDFPELLVWPVLLSVAVVIVPNLVVLAVGALSLAHLRVGRVRIFIWCMTPLGVLGIRRVHWARTRRYWRSIGALERIGNKSLGDGWRRSVGQ